MSIIDEKVNEIALKHIEIIENECKKAIEKYNCRPEDLILEYHSNTQIKIKIQASYFEITNNFFYDDGIIKGNLNTTEQINELVEKFRNMNNE